MVKQDQLLMSFLRQLCNLAWADWLPDPGRDQPTLEEGSESLFAVAGWQVRYSSPLSPPLL